ncbi:Radiation-inducible immediate-early gene IEX-1 [Varanus komodoensis]|uniref:Radiation-inducible immediate-early gene IEX-1 n=1 Tax=Varanus komodoensis TaxID=61221 RepID=A0A8D2J4Y1_VARKO|nr:radiation-inducible immediate-early gene IEX-1 [Varanus komodoensis]KAF7236219.1 Radiation-inducible immediate-early gene IEX-1 [Varanus komodoensis]
MEPLHGSAAVMCYACKPSLPAFRMPCTPAKLRPTGPQYFTFDPLPEVEKTPAHRNASKTSRSKKRARRVLYPPVVKRYYPAEERSYAKRFLFILLTIIFFQIYTAEEDVTLMVPSLSAEENVSGCSVETREHLLLEQLEPAALPWEIMEASNATGWDWADEDTSESTIDITELLEQSLAAF